MGLSESLVGEIVRRLLGVVPAERIILFGSAAAGDMTRNSDIDLLVVLEQRPKNSLEAHGRIHRTLRGLGYAFGVFRISRKEFEETKEIFGGIAYPAQRFGRVIHGTA